ncbi:uncharacterized protein [Venturia canescens]|nr:uncharacterized protein LOC122417899 isoform X2 [Venturia canescens]XP_043287731.1 uncharacterized protein LOC122417899 isoform X2 [Venturia canescens]
MESPPGQQSSQVVAVAHEDSNSTKDRDPATSSESRTAERSVPNAENNGTVRNETDVVQDVPVKLNQPDLTYLEISSRLGHEGVDDSAATSENPVPGSSEETAEQASNPGKTSGNEEQTNSSMDTFVGNKVLDDIESVMYDDNLFSDEALAACLSSSTPSRKRQPGDFLPPNAEIKRIGVEISEEHAKQLKNDVRRLSPVLVSLRERTLGEISLSSDSRLFEGGEESRKLETVGGIAEPAESVNDPEEGVPASSVDSIPPEVAPGESCSSSDSPSAESVPSSSFTNQASRGKTVAADVADCWTADPRVVDEHPQGVGAALENPSSPVARSELRGASTPNQRSNVQRELLIVLSRVDHGSPETGGRIRMPTLQETGSPRSAESEADSSTPGKSVEARLRETLISAVKSDDGEPATELVAESPVAGDRQDILDEKEVDKGAEETGGEKNATGSSAATILVAGDFCLSPKYHDNDQLRRKSPKVVLERTLEDGTSPRSVTGNEKLEDSEESLLRANLDRVRRTLESSMNGDEDEEEDDEDDASLTDPLAINEENAGVAPSDRVTGVAVDLQESLDTETETETGSDNSEIVSIASLQSRDCLIEPTNDGSTCPETDSVVSDEAPRDIITRLEPERPEAFTEDSAESLALATGARDEVRSDGSDSGLGSEIPGDPGTAPAPESDSETSFLDRIPDDILSDKDKAVNSLEAFAPDPGTSGSQQEHQEIHQQPQLPLPNFPNPPKSSLKRRLTDCMEGEPSPKRINVDEPVRKKRNIQFDAVTVYYFPRAQGFTCVPSQGGSTLGMSATHTHAERFSLTEHAAEQRRLHRARLAQLRSERAANCGTEAASSSEDPSDDTDEEPSDTEELDIDSYYFLQPVPTWQRRALLRAAGVRRIDAVEKDDCRDIRASREHCGCGCKGYCDPESCPCSRANVKCQVDRAGFPCGCSRDGCANSSGRIEFNPVRVRTHFIHTLMRLQLEKKQREEERSDHELLVNQVGRAPMREVPGMMGTPLGQMEHPNIITGDPVSCVNAGGFTTLHYDGHDPTSNSCPPGIVHPVREDSLDLYAIRDDCYPPDDVDGGPNADRKLHPEFGQAFQTFPGQQPAVNFPQGAYQDYQGYQGLASTSRSQFQPQFQTVSSANPTFGHYNYPPDPGAIQPPCQTHPAVSTHHPSVYDTGFPQEEPPESQQHYTNLNSVQPINSVVQQMGKLEPFSELLAGRYSYYGDPGPQPIPVGYHTNPATKIEADKSQIPVQQPVDTSVDDCDENFGEIIKKSMVETVSA